MKPAISLCFSLVLASLGCAAAASGAVPAVTPLYQFPGLADGETPWCNLTPMGGLLYGTTFSGGVYGRGSVFSIDPVSGTEKLVYSFQNATDATNPQAGVTVVGGLVYGVSNQGGAYGFGAVYSVDPATGTERVMFSLTPAMGGGSGSNIVAAGDYVYGTTFGGGTGAGFGVIFDVDLKTGVGSTLYAFTGGADGGHPQTGITYANGVIYGTNTSGGSGGNGTIFAVNATTGAETTLYSFTGGSDGSLPSGGVIDTKGVLYGTTTYGAAAYGTVFAYTLASSTLRTLYAFAGGADGGNPEGPVTYLKGVLYGAATHAGAAQFGTVFAVSAASGKDTTLYSFPGGAGGAYPLVGVIASGGALYGTTGEIGVPGINDGTVFEIALSSDAETTLHTFQGGINDSPASPVIDSGGTLYGTSGASATSLYGTIYMIDPATGTQTPLYTFTGGSDGGAPNGGLLAVGRLLYGVATLGGANGAGGIFSFDPATGAATLRASFASGANDARGPLVAVGGNLYGVISDGGQNGLGTIFAFDPATAALTTVHDFAGADGELPAGGLTSSAGIVYGTTYLGGSDGAGTLFSFDPATAALTELHDFTGGVDGGYPTAVPAIAGGTLYGATNYGGISTTCAFGSFGCGVLYSLALATDAFTALHSFGYTGDGAIPGALLVAGRTIYGGTGTGGGTALAGTLFSFDVASSAFSTIYTFSGNADGGSPDGLIRSGATIYGVGAGGGTFGQGAVFTLTDP